MNNQKQKMELLGNAPVAKALLAMGIPTMVSAKYSCGFSNLLDSSIIVNER